MLVGSSNGASILSGFKTFRIDVSAASKTLLTSDRPITASAQLMGPDAFMMLPYAPDRLVLLTHREAIAKSFSAQRPNVLVAGINQAIVEQSEDIVIAADKSATRMIERLFQRPQPGRAFDTAGMIRRNSPMIDLVPRPRAFTRHDKASLRYLGL